MNFNLRSKFLLPNVLRRFIKFSHNHVKSKRQKKSVLYYVLGCGITMLGFTYAGVPMYRIFCQVFYLL